MSKKKITICFFWPAYAGNGTSVDDLVVGFNRDLYNIIFVYLLNKGPSDNHLENAGFKVFCLCKAPRLRIFNPLIVLHLAGILKNNNVDILHCHRHKMTVYGTLAAVIAKTPVVCTHVHGLNRTRSWHRKLVNAVIYRRVHTVFGVAQAVCQDIIANNRIDPDKVMVLENSIDYNRFAYTDISHAQARDLLGIDRESFVFGTIGRLVPTKGLNCMLEAFALVKTEIIKARLVIIGTGPLESKLRHQTRKLGIEESVYFTGYRNDITRCIHGLDCFVLSSIAEGMPRVIIEAMAAGVPCISTDVGGIPEVINSPDVGVITRSRDSVSLADSMRKIAGLPKQKREVLIDNARCRIKKYYSHEVVREKLRLLYSRLLNEA